ncbi:ATP-binding cassette domain-containing protein [Sporichthya sp.]|uniref:branched-chain amino acid ABC transporter ATP-binding protein/permease n=1 Tax=Sporichthya sp. TaxID=65475 RepID=UPI0017B8C570|nr:ATP-binding cassette domain-containing protein [Sporichthya sp.]MBA3742386.1 branched-chain amino acid ABC transporter ATP-binding protein/permease [Sporichthya sp.]
MKNVPTLGRPDARRTTSRPVLTAMSAPGSLIAVALLVLYAFTAPDYKVFTVAGAVPIALTGLGLLVLIGWAREISLATAGIFGSAIYVMGYLTRNPEEGPGLLGAGGVKGGGLPWVLAAVIVIGGCALALALIALSSARLPGIYLVVLTFGLQIVIERTIYTYGDLAGGLSGGDIRGNILTIERPGFFGIDIQGDTAFYFFALGWLAVALVLLVRLRRSPVGLAFHLVGADRQAAAAVGINPLKFRVLAFGVSGALAGAGGIVSAWHLESPPVFINLMSPYSLLLLAIPVLAGLDSIAFVVLVAVSFQLTPVQLESLRISPFILAAVGLLAGAVFGSRGMGGRAADAYRYLLHGGRRTRTARERLDAAVLRGSEGLAAEDGGTPISMLSAEDRSAALAVLEAWLPPRPAIDNAAEARDIVVTFGAVHALDGASIRVPNQSMVGLLGPNGAGKSTLFDVISGVRRPDQGSVSLFGTDVSAMPAWDRAKLGVARTFQTTRVMPDLTVGDNLLSGAYQRIGINPLRFLAGDPRAAARLREAEDAAWAAARLLDIDRYWNERAGTLEFSARRRAEIGRCLLAGPRLLLLDEPAAGLDPASSVALFSLLKRLHADLGLTVLLVEHYVKAVLDSCDLVYVLAEGRILAEGTPAEVAANTEVRDRYLGTRMRYVPKVVVQTDAAAAAVTPEDATAAEISSP